MRILIATDAWYPQVNGVVQTFLSLRKELEKKEVETFFVTPKNFSNFECPFYPGIQMALPRLSIIENIIQSINPDYIHLATEGLIGWYFRRYCIRNKIKFTTSFHTRFPEYFSTIFGIPLGLGYACERIFHTPSSGIMVSTSSFANILKERGFSNIMQWSRGVDTKLFKPRSVRLFGSDKPIFLYVGRVSKEKNIDDFLKIPLPGMKVVVGDGPYLSCLKRCYSDVVFTGSKFGEDLALLYASADVFVFPSRTDTFGLVILEALASGLPVAAFPVTGPMDIIENGISGVLDDDLKIAALKALSLKRENARLRALQFTWAKSASQFLQNIQVSNLVNSFQSKEHQFLMFEENHANAR